MKKIQPPDERSFISKALFQIFSILVDVVLSWIGVVINIFHIMVKLFQILRELLVSTPEEIKTLRFPLINNPNLSREAVWAHFIAIQIKMGADSINESTIASSLEELRDYYPLLNRDEALSHLSYLNVVDNSLITSAQDQITDNDSEFI